MEFRNLTPYPAMAFDALDQHDQRFHVVVMRLTFTLQPDGQLLLATHLFQLLVRTSFSNSDWQPADFCTRMTMTNQ